MRLRALLVALVLGLLLVRPAPAVPYESQLGDLIAEVERLSDAAGGNDPAELLRKRFLEKIAKVLGKKSKSLATDAGRVASIARLLEKGGSALDALLDDLEDDMATQLQSIGDSVTNLVANTQGRADALPDDSKFKTRANKKLDKIREILANADEQDLVALGKAYKRALLKRRIAAKLVKKGEKKATR